ncbi:CMRF35-like molecule 6 [Nyctibius grandis]|uniref:CMRF35-like molecule 6 n=1 Tax=Nyctibius grandis TaxID=48427 RepID=UPI0035BC7DF7
MQLLLLTWTLLPGCWAVMGPGTVRGFVGGSLSVTCRYRPGHERMPKYWCKPGALYTCAEEIVITSELQPLEWWDRFSIWDNREERVFTVTVERLSERDAGTYRCGVRTGVAQFDESAVVEVIVSPDPALSPAPALPPPAVGTPGPFRYFPVLAGLQVLALLAMSGAVLWVSLRGR